MCEAVVTTCYATERHFHVTLREPVTTPVTRQREKEKRHPLSCITGVFVTGSHTSANTRHNIIHDNMAEVLADVWRVTWQEGRDTAVTSFLLNDTLPQHAVAQHGNGHLMKRLRDS